MRKLSNKLTGIELLGLMGVAGTIIVILLLRVVLLVNPAAEFLKENFFNFFLETYTYGILFLVIQIAGFSIGYLSSEGLSKPLRQRIAEGACLQMFFLFFFGILWSIWIWSFSYFKTSDPSGFTLLTYIKAAAISYLIVTVILTVVYYINQFLIWGYENYPKTKYILRSLFP